MSESQAPRALDLIRWTFSVGPDSRSSVETYLHDLGIDVRIDGEGRCVALWDEPEDDADADAVIDGLWDAIGGPVEVIHEEFRRLDLQAYHADDHGDGDASAAA